MTIYGAPSTELPVTGGAAVGLDALLLCRMEILARTERANDPGDGDGRAHDKLEACVSCLEAGPALPANSAIACPSRSPSPMAQRHQLAQQDGVYVVLA